MPRMTLTPSEQRLARRMPSRLSPSPSDQPVTVGPHLIRQRRIELMTQQALNPNPQNPGAPSNPSR